MSLSVLISDVSVPFASSLAGVLRGRDLNVSILSGLESDSPLDLPWNRSSALSARTVLLGAKNRFAGSLDCAILVFDASSIPAACRDPGGASLTRLSDEYIRGYLLLAAELEALFARQKKGLLCFVVAETPAAAGAVRFPAGAVAESAFARLAEETALSLSSSAPSAQTMLVKLDGGDESANLEWLVSSILNPASRRKESRWIRSGSRGLFGKI